MSKAKKSKRQRRTSVYAHSYQNVETVGGYARPTKRGGGNEVIGTGGYLKSELVRMSIIGGSALAVLAVTAIIFAFV